LTRLYALTFKSLKKLKELYLNNNRLQRVDSRISIFTGLNELNYLNLESNFISYFRNDSLEDLNNLKQLCLYDNEISERISIITNTDEIHS
jgi:Leucine-rich repeat (LRR) protein